MPNKYLCSAVLWKDKVTEWGRVQVTEQERCRAQTDAKIVTLLCQVDRAANWAHYSSSRQCGRGSASLEDGGTLYRLLSIRGGWHTSQIRPRHLRHRFAVEWMLVR